MCTKMILHLIGKSGDGGYQVTSSAPLTRFAVCKTARDTCCGTSHCLDDTLYEKRIGEYLSCGGKCPQSPTLVVRKEIVHTIEDEWYWD